MRGGSTFNRGCRTVTRDANAEKSSLIAHLKATVCRILLVLCDVIVNHVQVYVYCKQNECLERQMPLAVTNEVLDSERNIRIE